jgi:hypothetical protein
MPEAGNYYVVTLRGDRGPMSRQAMAEQLHAGEIAGTDHVRNAFGRPLGTVAELLGGDAPRGAAAPRSSARLQARRPPVAPPAKGPSPVLIVVLGLLLVAAVGVAFLLSGSPAPPQPQVQPMTPRTPPRPQVPKTPPPKPVETAKPGLLVDIFRLNYEPKDFPTLSSAAKPDWLGSATAISFDTCLKAGITQNLYARWQGKLDISQPGTYTFHVYGLNHAWSKAEPKTKWSRTPRRLLA